MDVLQLVFSHILSLLRGILDYVEQNLTNILSILDYVKQNLMNNLSLRAGWSGHKG